MKISDPQMFYGGRQPFWAGKLLQAAGGSEGPSFLLYICGTRIPLMQKIKIKIKTKTPICPFPPELNFVISTYFLINGRLSW